MRSTSRLALALAVVVTGGCRAPELPVLGTLPPFALTERSGRPLTSDDLRGHVWIADFVFTRCPDFCPALTARMARLQDQLDQPDDGKDAVRLVSFTVDPAHDTPAVLAAYAGRAGARADWLFVTGDRDTLATLFRDGFHLAWSDQGTTTSPITHSDRFVLVDRALRIRGYYHGTDDDEVRRLGRDAGLLRRETAA